MLRLLSILNVNCQEKKGKKIALRWTRKNWDSSSSFGFTLVMFSDWECDLNTAACTVHVASSSFTHIISWVLIFFRLVPLFNHRAGHCYYP